MDDQLLIGTGKLSCVSHSIPIRRKVCVMGSYAVGKTSLVQRFVHNRWSNDYVGTLGVRVSQKTLSVASRGELSLMTLSLWDIDGRQAFNALYYSYLRGVQAALLVCDLTRAYTLDSLRIHAAAVQQVNPQAPLLVVATKRDLPDQHEIALSEVDRLALGLKAPCHFVDCTVAEEVDAAFRHVARLLASQV